MSGEDPPVEYLTVEDLVVVGDVAIRDRGLLASAAARPHSSALGEDAYPRLAEKAAALMHSLARNHALADGNTRLAWAATRIFCLLNGRDILFSVDDAEALVVAVAAGQVDVLEITSEIDQHLR